MTLKEVLEKAAAIICDDEIDLNVQSKKRDKLVSCGNMIYQELTQEYVHLKTTDTLSIDDKRIYYSAFPKAVKEILSIYVNGAEVSFEQEPLFVRVDAPSGKCEVRYVYNVPEVNLSDTLTLPPQYTATILAVGVAAEFFFRSGLSDEAIFYKNRYDTSLINLSRKKRPLTVAYRRFI